ncbi:probable GPI-anchored adhesin-like protein PGA55, partial [Lucilia sericata]|uniref:probable GPI-anchored adhesin-like protein PGA55 n=1 Tax=Lucilia sericata TaxID=13632 RepID=UPI0018A830E2
SNDLHCTHIQCPTKCPHDSYLKSALDDEEDEDYEDEFLGHDPYIEELGYATAHSQRKTKREVFFQEEIERCCDDQKCVCNKCDDVPKCAAGYVAIEVHEGQGLPGNCCSIYKCVEKEECKMGVKQSWWTNKCRKCSCFGESEMCLQICPEEEILQNCYSEYLQKPMMNGAFWKEGSCTSCTCEKGERRCFAPGCPELDCKHTETFEDECCPKCLDDNDLDERPEIVHNNEEDIEEVVEDYTTESSTIETPLIRVSEETNSTISIENANLPVIDEGLINEAQTISPWPRELSTKPFEVEEISSSTYKPETGDLFAGNTSHSENATLESLLETMSNSTVSTIWEISSSSTGSSEESLPSTVTSTEVPKMIAELVLDSVMSNNNTITEESKPIEDFEEISSTTISSTTAFSFDISKSVQIEELEQDSSSTITTTEEPQTSSISTVTKTSTEVPVELVKEETTTTESLLTTTTEEISSTTSRSGESSSIMEDIFSSTASTTISPIDFETTKASETSIEVNSVFTTTQTPETTMASSLSYSTSAAFESSTTEETSNTIKTISSPTIPKINSDESSTYTPLETTTTETSNQTPTTSTWTSTQTPLRTSSTSSQSSTTISSTSTTSSPFSYSSDFTTSTEVSISAESSSTSTTTAPEPLKPLYQPYGDFSTEERAPSTQNRMRIIFDEIDYVVMIVLFIGSMLCIALGLIIRHTKNRKKMYSSIPNSETSLSQTSTVIDVIPV